MEGAGIPRPLHLYYYFFAVFNYNNGTEPTSDELSIAGVSMCQIKNNLRYISS